MPNEIKKFPHTLSINAEQLSNMQRKSISPSSTTAPLYGQFQAFYWSLVAAMTAATVF